ERCHRGEREQGREREPRSIHGRRFSGRLRAPSSESRRSRARRERAGRSPPDGAREPACAWHRACSGRRGVRIDPRRLPGLLPLLLLAAVALPTPAAGADPPPVGAAPARGAPASRAWALAPEPVAADGGLRALAVGPAGAAAAGDARGLLVRVDDGGWRRSPLRGAVSDLAFAPDGVLWVASDEGLFRLAAERGSSWRLVAHPVAPGDAARTVVRVAAAARALAAATQEGVYWSRDGQRFARVEGSFAAGGAIGRE